MIIGLAVALGVWAVTLFRRARTGVVPFSEATVLVRAGPYRFTCNPMYVGMAGILVGTAIWLGSITPWLVLPAPEETMLERTFGSSYVEYKAAVRRWL